jgi:asparagine synthase (glutamine-hydrolysing)
MCGIAGFTAPGAEARRIIALMNQALAHRGPDGVGSFVDRDIAFGHTRLAIIDLAGGAQPRLDPSGDALVFNGEIYGYQELAEELRAAGIALRDRSDTEVLFQLLRRHGVRDTARRIGGMFAFAFRDGATGAVHLVRDRFGEKPLYYGIAGGQLVFASEAAALFCHPAFVDAEPDPLAIYRYLLFEYLPIAGSGWKGIEKLEPGSILTFDRGRVAIEHYWRPRVAPRPMPPDAAKERLEELLRAAVRRMVVADRPVGVFLSGGLDSSLIAAFAREAAPGLAAFTVRIGGGGFDETPHARRVAHHLGLRHEVVELDENDLARACDAIGEKLSEPLGDSSLLPSWLVCHAARRQMAVALGGDGADELFAGYPNFPAQRFAAAMRLVPSAFGRALRAGLAALPAGERYMSWRFRLSQLSQGFGAAPLRQSFLWMAPFACDRLDALWRRAAFPENAGEAVFAILDERAADGQMLPPIERLLQLFLATYLPDDILTKTDRASMFNGFEMRAPFLDREVADFALSLPSGLKLNG